MARSRNIPPAQAAIGAAKPVSRNATPPEPGVAPGIGDINPAAFATAFTLDPRIPQAVPGFDAPFFQAGLAGYSDSAMRCIARRHGCPYCVTEALLDRTLLDGGRGFAKADLGELEHNTPASAEDHPLAGQIMGSDPDEMAAAAVKMVEQGRRSAKAYRLIRERGLAAAPQSAGAVEAPERTFATIDVNVACPVKKISRKARGGHWLCQPEGAIGILRAVREAVPDDIPVTMKIRRGSDDSPQAERNFYTLFDAAYEIGIAWATVHGRTVEQKYVGPSNWGFLRELVRRRPDRVIFGSGDIWSAEDIFRMIEYTGVHAVSVARGCIGNPWIFRQARALMRGETPRPPTIAEQRTVLQDHYLLSSSVNGERRASLMMRKFGVRFSAHHPERDEVHRRFVEVKTADDWMAVLDQWYPIDAPRAPEAAHA
ncbi:MAG: tRNA-dihydrouridine synthase family protein [Phycisphaeraceae bacterium]|nr:tRNA-dihydrouridine synthase family protein [Phycisphaeraceae bacterium]